jgi:hypothetical protein
LKEIIPSFVVPRSKPETTLERFGLRSRGLWWGPPADPVFAGLSQPARFCNALEEIGGLYAAFGQYLCWRADLLRTEYLHRLRQIRVKVAPIGVAAVAQMLSNELGDVGAVLAQRLEPEPCWNTLARCAYRTQYQGRTIVAQVARDPIPDSAFKSLGKGLRLIDDERLREAFHPTVLASFREWMRISDSPQRERSYLDALAAVRDRTLAMYPAVIPEISAGKVLCLEWVEGEPVAGLIIHGSAAAVERVAEYALDQVCAVAAADGDFDPDSLVLTPSGRLALRRANRMVAMPPSATQICLKYISAVLASNAPSAAQMLVKLANGRSNMDLESRLLDALSNIEPELKVNLQFPPSATIFEGNWRALTRTGARKPLFLDIMHRNLIATGYWNADVAVAPQPAVDLISQAHWPVLSRILRTGLGNMARSETASDWFIGSGLLFFEALRTLNSLTEGLRENDLSLGVDLQHEEDSSKLHQRIRSGILIGMLLAVFLASLRFAVSPQGPWSAALSALAAAAGLALFWFVSRFD